MVRHKLSRLALDINMAYCQADLPDAQLIAVRYPEGFRRYRTNDRGEREEEFMILRKNLYGHPAAGRNWAKQRDAELMKIFNKDGWTCKRCIKDPCMFVITKAKQSNSKNKLNQPDNSTAQRAWMLVWVDDCDIVGESDELLEEIYSKINQRWESKKVDPSYMLGIKREITVLEQGNMEVELTMTAYVEAMAEAFKDHLIKRSINTPVPDGFFTYKKKDANEAEAERVLERGYQRLFGMLLWAARGTYVECLQGCSLLGRVMSQPTEESWNAACHMLTYMYQHKDHGIKYSTRGNRAPVCYVDSSNKPDPTDGKCQYGYCHLWQGGTIINTSKKLAHVGLSAAHNEYMAAHWANRHTAWLRDLLMEMGVEDAIPGPTDTYADNRAANLLCEEDIVTCGNQFMQVPYHYNKEAVANQVVQMHYCPTKANLADLFTKSVSRQVLEALLPALLGHCPPPDPAAAAARAPDQTAAPLTEQNDPAGGQRGARQAMTARQECGPSQGHHLAPAQHKSVPASSRSLAPKPAHRWNHPGRSAVDVVAYHADRAHTSRSK